ncbi:hypothetical protein NC99_42330 [Sunxiuqinia dokdonensis]|uniref:Uncharacterized protein n=1 Tax=Sunxiuqinia dokdonensis TaxID=1409788 RepID=A0A0L8V3B5_9BACT|nr:hypothetical protein NC99_42330 [Sunxiuqinia dokdonensis]
MTLSKLMCCFEMVMQAIQAKRLALFPEGSLINIGVFSSS